jgi:hypothetical protein
MAHIKKTIIFILLFFSINTIKSQNDLFPKTIIKIGVTKKTYTIDFGYVNDKSIYQTLSFSIPLKFNSNNYASYGVGYKFKNNFYGMGLIGMTNDFKSTPPLLFYGVEGGYITENLVGSLFYSNMTGVGVKIGYIFDFNKKLFGGFKK